MGLIQYNMIHKYVASAQKLMNSQCSLLHENLEEKKLVCSSYFSIASGIFCSNKHVLHGFDNSFRLIKQRHL